MSWDGEGTDPWLTARLEHAYHISEAEQRVYAAAYAALESWLVSTSRRLLAAARPDPHAVFAEAPLWERALAGIIRAVTPIMGDQFKLLGDDYDWKANQGVRNYLTLARNRMIHTPDEVYAMVAGQVAAGAGGGESIPQIRDRIQNVLSVTDTPTWSNRAATIARTETLGALNASRDLAFREYVQEVDEPLQKLWLATEGARTRESHARVDGDRVPVGTAFSVGGASLQFPGDPSGPPGEVINCRCTMLLVAEGEDTDLTEPRR